MGGEGNLRNRCARWLGKLQAEGKVWYLKVHGSPWQRAGVPDFLICAGGYFLAVELKAPDGSGVLSPAQAAEILAINRSGGVALYVRRLEDLQCLVAEALACSEPLHLQAFGRALASRIFATRKVGEQTAMKFGKKQAKIIEFRPEKAQFSLPVATSVDNIDDLVAPKNRRRNRSRGD